MQYTSAAAGHVHKSNAHIHSCYLLSKEWSTRWGKSEVVITFGFQRQFPLATVPFVSKEVIDWSPNLQINILSEGFLLFFFCFFFTLSAMLKGHSSSGWWMGANAAQGLRVDCERNVLYLITHTKMHTKTSPPDGSPPSEQQGPLWGCICVCDHACMHLLDESWTIWFSRVMLW